MQKVNIGIYRQRLLTYLTDMDFWSESSYLLCSTNAMFTTRCNDVVASVQSLSVLLMHMQLL